MVNQRIDFMPSDSQPLLSVIMTKTILSPGSEVVAKADFKSTSPEHLSFVKGDIMTILPKDGKREMDENWCFAMHTTDTHVGLIPVNHLQIRNEVQSNSMPWFHGKITREEAEKILQPAKVSILITQLLIIESSHINQKISNIYQSYSIAGRIISCSREHQFSGRLYTMRLLQWKS